MESVEQDNQDNKNNDLYFLYSSKKWLQNKNRKTYNDGSKGSYYYYCKSKGCKEPRCLNEKTDPEYESSIKSQYCEMHKCRI
jgi:hypothetical protein